MFGICFKTVEKAKHFYFNCERHGQLQWHGHGLTHWLLFWDLVSGKFDIKLWKCTHYYIGIVYNKWPSYMVCKEPLSYLHQSSYCVDRNSKYYLDSL